MYTAVTIAQYTAIALLALELVYTLFQKTSKAQLLIMLMILAALFMMIGYIIETTATTLGVAMIGAKIGYLGKPFVLLISFLFVAHFCGYSVSDKVTACLILVHIFFTILVFTTDRHNLFYSSIGFDRSRVYSPLVLGHGAFYYIYTVLILFYFVADFYLAIKAMRAAENKVSRRRVLLVFGTIFSSLGGFGIFLSGVTAGYDSTMFGCFIGTLLLFILFLRYRLFDVLTVIKDKSLDGASYGFLVVNHNDKVVYQNDMMEDLISLGLSVEPLLVSDKQMPALHFEDKVYSATCSPVVEDGRLLGRTLEISDVTTAHNYADSLELAVRERTQQIFHIQRTIIAGLANLVDARDDSTGTHVKRTAEYVHATAEKLRNEGIHSNVITKEYVEILTDIAPLHDIGKVYIPDRILLKNGRLTGDEFAVIKTHTTLGAQIIEDTMRGVEKDDYVSLAKDLALSHHEKWDGSGYPQGLSGEDIPLCARIMAVADVYDAVRSKRCYKESMSREEARQIILDGKGVHFDPIVADAFIHCLDAGSLTEY